MRERSLDEFESVFEQASIPVLDIRDVALTRISAVLTGDPLDESILTLAAYFRDRFGSDVRFLWAASAAPEQVRQHARSHGFQLPADSFVSTAELVGQVSISQSRLVLLPEPDSPPARLVDLDAFILGTAPPVLVVRTAVEDPRTVFGNILHTLTGNFQQTQNFSYSFTLKEDGGRLWLLHVIDESEMDDVREALQVSPDIAAQMGEALLDELTRHGERYLKAVVAASRKRPFDVAYRLAAGDFMTTVRGELAARDYGLMVVGSHIEGHSHVTTDDYQLMHQVRDVPVLAL